VRICLASGKLYPGQGILEGSLIDITERKHAEDKLRESEARFRATVYSIGDGVITTDIRGQMVHMNPVAEELTGWGESEAKGIPAKTIFNIFSEDGQTNAQNPIDRALDEGVVVNLANHTWLQARDGIRRPIADSGAPIRDKAGDVIGAVLVFRDQTAELKIKQALEENERKYRQLFENLIAGLALHEIILDPEGIPIDYCFLEVNVAFEQLTGLKSLDIIGHTVREIIPTIEDKWIQNYGKVAITGIPMVFDDYNAALDRYYHVMAYCPRIGQFAAIFTDITAQKRNQILTQQMNAELERRVHERTAQLESVNRELESFAHSVSHDLRAPLRSMRGFSSIVLEEYKDVLDSVGVDYLTRIKDSAQWMDQLINDLLELSRVTRANFNDQKVDLSALVRTIETELEAQYSERQVNWIIQEGVEVYGDDHLLHIALLNLLDNALKFTSRRTDAQIEFGAIFQNGETTYWIRDNGVGFDMTYADKLFQPFQRLHPVNEFSGTGIGLATVKRIITRHDGQIWVESSPNHGTTFYFSLGMKNPNRKS
jgi:PAS domain S-box-containing protein